MKRIAISLLASVALTACDVTPPLEITSEPATVSFLKSAPRDRIRDNYTDVTVRAFQPAQTEDGKPTSVEVAGAKCNLTSDHLRAQVVTPQVVRLPKYDQIAKLEDRGVPPSVLIECRAGKLKGSQLLAARPGQVSTGGSGNLVVDLIILAGTAAVAATADWRYEPASVVNLQ